MQIEVIKSRRKSMALQLKNSDLLLVRVPLRTSQRRITRFIENHHGWISRQRQKLQQNPGLPDSNYADGGQLWLIGERYDITVKVGKRGVTLTSDNTLQVSHPTCEHAAVARQISAWKRAYATDYFESLLAEQYSTFPVKLPAYRFQIRQMRRQWGNCARDGLIKLNVSLIRYPEVCIRHVIWHELCHLKHFNHSREFYALLARVEPDWQDNKELLMTYSG